jgi:NAD(P)-dependent dehydrogenase (short-subunit alcohol dehydrogenase family)
MRELAGATALRERLAAERLADVEIRALDVTELETLPAVVDDVVTRYGSVDVLVNNAGRAASGPLETVDLQVLRGIFDTNVVGAMAVTQAVLPHMRVRGSGRVIFVSALGAVVNTPWMGAYCGSKHAIDSMAAVLDLEVRPLGIRVSSIVPAAFRTPLAERGAALGEVPEPYRDRAELFAAGFGRRVADSTDLRPVVDALLEVVDAADPPLRRLVAPGKEDLFGPLVQELDARHEQDVAAHC